MESWPALVGLIFLWDMQVEMALTWTNAKPNPLDNDLLKCQQF